MSPVIFLGLIAAALGITIAIRKPEALRPAIEEAGRQGGKIALRVLLGIFIAAVLARVIPVQAVGPLIGPDSGVRGILIGTVFGAIVPGGPMVTFPIAMTLWDIGAGQPQVVAFLASWSIFAVHRVLSYEWPMMGGRFVLIRLLSAWYLPPVAGLLALALLALMPNY